MTSRNMAMKVISLFLLLSIISHASAKTLGKRKVFADVIDRLEKEIQDLAQHVKNDEAVEEAKEAKRSDEGPSIWEVDLKEKTQELGKEKGVTVVGDELEDDEQVEIMKKDNVAGIAKDAIKRASQRWPKIGNTVIVPYVLDDAISNNARKKAAIDTAIRNYAEKSCIRWVEATDKSQHHVKFINDRGCYSYIGRVTRINNYNGFQPISIGNGCGYVGTVEHEMLHCLGFFHEQSRPDRDTYVKILIGNLINPAFANNFAKQNAAIVDSAGQPYDIGSVMHYGSTYFAKPGTNTIETIDGDKIIPNRAGFSAIDLKQLNAIYTCGGTPEPITTPKPGPGPGPGPGEVTMCKGLTDLGLCGYSVVCNLCKPQCTAPTDPDDKKIIVDIEGTEKCQAWKGKGYCAGQYKDWMARFCMKTCFEVTYTPQGECQ